MSALVWDCGVGPSLAVSRMPSPESLARGVCALVPQHHEDLPWCEYTFEARHVLVAAYDPRKATLYIVGPKTPLRTQLAYELREELIHEARTRFRVIDGGKAS